MREPTSFPVGVRSGDITARQGLPFDTVQQPTTQTVYDLFNGRIQFIVPVYQRAYVWNEAENWGVLWEDIADTAERYIADPTAHVRQRHFLGPIVLDQQPVEAGGVDPRLVIDGQQRLTTLQIILSA